jgi:hypothetical protein
MTNGIRAWAGAAGLLAALGAAAPWQLPAPGALGVFDGHGDIGVPSTIGAGTAVYDRAGRVYTIAGGGENMWSRADHFHYVWKKMSGDVTLSATVAFTGSEPGGGTPNEHRKACLVLRQTLDSDSAYVDAASHGNGMTALQWRDRAGDVSHDIETNVVAPRRLKIEKRGNRVMMFVAVPGGPWRPAGGSTRIDLAGEFYVGLGVSSHETSRIETATFSDVEISAPAPLTAANTALVSTVETLALSSKDRRVAHVSMADAVAEAPNWFPDATQMVYFNQGGRLYRVMADLPRAALNAAGPRQPEAVDLGGLTHIGHDHVVSRDGSQWAVSDQAQGSIIYVAPGAGGPAVQAAAASPAYVRSWSPDGRTLAYAADRGGNLDIYTIPAAGGAERRLTTGPARDDGPEFSPDGRFIYFNSDRSGSMQVWRMRVDGADAEPLTDDDYANWCPHLAPDGRMLVFLSARKSADGRFENGDLLLRRLTLDTRAIDDLTKLYGGKGTLNVSSFSPAGTHLAFVSYQQVAR